MLSHVKLERCARIIYGETGLPGIDNAGNKIPNFDVAKSENTQRYINSVNAARLVFQVLSKD